MKRTLLLIAVIAFLLPIIHAQKTVLGTVDYSYILNGEGAASMANMMPTKMIIKYGENGLSMVMEGGMMGGMMGKTIVNGETGEAFIIKDLEKAVYMMSEEDLDKNAEQVENSKIEKQDETKEIMGYKCQKYVVSMDVQGQSISQVLWVTDKLKSPDYKGKAFQGMSGSNPMNFDIDGFPLMVEIDLPGMPVTMQIKVTNIDFGKIKKSEFERPADFEVKPFSSMMSY